MLLPRVPASQTQRVAVRSCGVATLSDLAWDPRVGALHASGIFLPHSLEPANGGEGSYRQLMGKRATVILSSERREEVDGNWKGGGMEAIQLTSDDRTSLDEYSSPFCKFSTADCRCI